MLKGFSFSLIPGNGALGNRDGFRFEVRRHGKPILGGYSKGNKQAAKQAAAKALVARRPSITR